MIRINRPPVDVATDGIASRFLLLDQRVVVCLADALGVLQVEEQRRVTLVRLLVVDHCCAGMVPIACDEQAAAALAGVQVPKQRLLANAMRPVAAPVSAILLVEKRPAMLTVMPWPQLRAFI